MGKFKREKPTLLGVVLPHFVIGSFRVLHPSPDASHSAATGIARPRVSPFLSDLFQELVVANADDFFGSRSCGEKDDDKTDGNDKQSFGKAETHD
ncbi:hypothetical protein NZK35_19175 [Stieleria sp. ICT_E10.1]|uniref:hypothetical protein n=1 Tax=Stieleria sedimenti TaxID=2976331 RepID=UPI00217FDAEE|nr:hypothetical protein [Stieleria sedimenti]MCS7468779.1 hypothetical protein [Stieleria sedimenti]